MKKRANFFEVWGGISGCQHLLPLLLNITAPGSVLSPGRLAELTSSHVAARFRVSSKGGIAVGRDADLTLINEVPGEAITREELRYRHKQSAYVGTRLRSRIVRTILRGQTIFENGRITAERKGRFVRPDHL
jgi:allantoinase